MDAFITRRGGTGDGLNATIVGGTAQPASPKENTIWANTDAEITGWSFSAVQPVAPTEGMVWFESGGSNGCGLNILVKNEAFVYPYGAMQYVSGVWVPVEAKSYTGGQWVDWKTYLIHGNDLCSDLTGGWSAVAKQISQYGGTAAKPSVTTGDGCIKISSASGKDGIVYTAQKVDLTNYKTLVFKGSAVVSSQGYGHSIVIWSSIGTYWDASGTSVAKMGLSDSPTDATRRLSVENLTGSYYIGFGMFYGGSFTVEALYLE